MSKWERFDKELLALQKSIGVDVGKHNKKAQQFKMEAMIWKCVMIFGSAIMGVAMAYAKELGCPWADLTLQIWSVTFIPALTAFYSWREPEQKRADHIAASAEKGSISTKIKTELLLSQEERQDPDKFFEWVDHIYSDACSDGPFLG
jgi:H+/gluconate symporter-like permease